MYALNQRVFSELYSAESPEQIAANARRAPEYIAEQRRQWVGQECFWHGELIDRLPGANVIEIGCGSGQTAMTMLAMGAAHVTALEINDTTEHLVKEAAGILDYTDRIDIRIGDMMSMDLDAKAYDIVICESVLHHITPPQEDEFIARTAELLAPSGMTRVSDPAVNSKTLDAIRWAIPTPWRPSSLQREKFAAWQAEDEHPLRDNSTRHVAELLGHHYGRVEWMTHGVIARVQRAFPDGEYLPKLRQRMVRFDAWLPDVVRNPLAAFHGLSAFDPLG